MKHVEYWKGEGGGGGSSGEMPHSSGHLHSAKQPVSGGSMVHHTGSTQLMVPGVHKVVCTPSKPRMPQAVATPMLQH